MLNSDINQKTAQDVADRCHFLIAVKIILCKKVTMKILICVDNSAQCEKIFLASKNILATRVPAAEITILHIVDDKYDSNIIKDINELAKQYFDMDFYYMEVKGVIKDEINQALDNANYDLIVFGTKGHSALTNIILGSTAEYLLHTIEIPMLLVP